MALKRNPNASFEDTGADATVVETTVANDAVEQACEPAVASPAAKVTATTAIAKAQAGALAAPAQRIAPVLTDLKDAVRVDWDTLERLVAGTGTIDNGDGKSVGTWIKMTLMSFQDTYEVVPGDQSDEAKKLVRYSEDGVNLRESGTTVNQYLDELREQGYDKAALKHKNILVGILDETEKPSDLVGEVIQISLSPQSRKTFERYRLTRTAKVNMGRATAEGSEVIKITAEGKQFGKNKFTQLTVTGADE
ncbi:hypothetical protein [Cupriavidus necator]